MSEFRKKHEEADKGSIFRYFTPDKIKNFPFKWFGPTEGKPAEREFITLETTFWPVAGAKEDEYLSATLELEGDGKSFRLKMVWPSELGDVYFGKMAKPAGKKDRYYVVDLPRMSMKYFPMLLSKIYKWLEYVSNLPVNVLAYSEE